MFRSGLRSVLSSRVGWRNMCAEYTPTDSEMKLINVLRIRFPTANVVDVQDISGGCGSMYQVHVISKDFEGVPLLQQHKLVTETLRAEIKDMHGIRISTSSKT